MRMQADDQEDLGHFHEIKFDSFELDKQDVSPAQGAGAGHFEFVDFSDAEFDPAQVIKNDFTGSLSEIQELRQARNVLTTDGRDQFPSQVMNVAMMTKMGAVGSNQPPESFTLLDGSFNHF